jgi:hypothetical protein
VKGNFQAITAKETAIIVSAIFVQRSSGISSSPLDEDWVRENKKAAFERPLSFEESRSGQKQP